MLFWIRAARLKTLPLAASGILLGSAVAYLNKLFNPAVLVFGLITALLLQILSNFANDYGDFLKGTDQQAGRQDRMLAAGKISKGQMVIAMVLLSIFILGSGLMLLYYSGLKPDVVFAVFFVLGLSAIAAAIKYTVGKFAYAYAGLGDLFVIIFFGFVSVCGIFYLHTGLISNESLLAGFGIGLLSTGVLNVNNIRDLENDKKSHKKTLPVRLGPTAAMRYHLMLCTLGPVAVISAFVYHIQSDIVAVSPIEYLMVLAVFTPVLFVVSAHVRRMFSLAIPKKTNAASDKKILDHSSDKRNLFNRELKNLSLATLAISLIWWLMAWMYI